MKKGNTIEKTVILAMLAAISVIVVYFVHIPILPSAPFLEYDPADVPILLASIIVSPWWAILLTVVVSVLQGMMISGINLGIIMHIVATASAALVCGLIYRRKRNFLSALLGLISAVAIATAVMIPMNYFITPIHVGMARSIVAQMIPTVFIPFNLIKFGLNSLVTLLLFKPITIALNKLNFKY